MKLRGIKSTSPRWIVIDEVGGPVTFHNTQDEAHAAGKERGAGQTIVYVARILLTNDSAQWATSSETKFK
jgi:hypothetical protein